MILNIDSIILRRNKKVLFSNLSLNLPESQILILKGSNGVGKSSLLEAICGLVEIDKGKIFLTKEKLNTHYSFTSDYFFYLGHENCLKDNLTVIENLLIWSNLSNLNLRKDEISINCHILVFLFYLITHSINYLKVRKEKLRLQNYYVQRS